MAFYKDQTTYECEVIQQGFNESANKGTPGFFMVIKPVGEIDPQDTENMIDCQSFERTMQMWITDNTVDSRIDDLRKIGFDGKSFMDLDPDRRGSFSFVGRRVRLYCKHEEGTNGKVYDKFEVPFWNAPKVRENAPKMAAKLANLYDKKLKSGPQQPANSSKAPPKQPVRQTVPNDDGGPPDEDIPF